MNEQNLTRLMRWAGLAGLTGAIVMLLGDMAFYGRADSSIDNVAMMGMVPIWRLYLGGLLGPVAGLLYVLGTPQIYVAIRPAGRWWTITIAGSFLAMMVFNGAYHTAFTSWGLAAQLAATDQQAGDVALANVEPYLQQLRLLGAVPLLIFTIGFALAVGLGKTRYPRWMAPFSPLVMLFVLPFIASRFTGVLYVILQGGIANIVYIVFFALSTAVLWNGGRRDQQPATTELLPVASVETRVP